ncbi:type II secretion system F family protein [Paeniglutamicibacter cryotolerans]|uniref:Tight adherence protein B n=1 Tax=Paeniglutamicibacter cryotolerans TaxID=670079 RepID=A0A839QI86_9MICC|nr:hypothetical protein [Paeniglutamicibacter cryotolerans]MBB2994235.1 tight adherence protein B [Paeniglutamicibacter cryotolerans]
MSVVMALLAGALAGVSLTVLGRNPRALPRSPDRHRNPVDRHGSMPIPRRWRPATRNAATPDAHVRFTRQLAALLRSGSSLDGSFATLETVWTGTVPQDHTSADIAAACRLARTSRTLGRSPGTGLSAHARAAGAYAGYWWRLTWCVSLSESSGAALATLLEHVADQLEAAADRERALDVALAGPRSTRKLLGWLPVAGLGMAQLAGANPVGVLVTDPAGRLALVAGAVLWSVNAFWAARLLAAARGRIEYP